MYTDSHEESLGNTDQTAYERIPDWLIPLTEHGITSGDVSLVIGIKSHE